MANHQGRSRFRNRGTFFREFMYGFARDSPLMLVEDVRVTMTGLHQSRFDHLIASLWRETMRLTLRTMLAYLDDILEPADAKDLGEKIEESEVATNLVHRVRSSVRRLRLEAPALQGTGTGGDANSVAEYLDNTLSNEQVAEFEKVAIESDVHLAETAACHQVLTLVLGEPANIEQSTRQRMYRLVSRTVSGQVGETEVGHDGQATGAPPPRGDMAGAAATTTGAADGPTPSKREIPDYLKAGSRVKVVPIVVVLLLAGLLAGAIFMAMQPNGFLAAFRDGSEEGATVADPAAGNSKQSAAEEQAADATGPNGVAASPTDTPIDETPDAGPDTTPSGDDGAFVPPDAGAPGVGDGAGDAPMPPLPPEPDDLTPPEGGVPTVPGDGGETPDTEVAVVDPEKTPPDMIPVEPTDVPPERVEVGLYTSDDQQLTRYDAANEAWMRVPARSTLASGDHILALPAFRPQLMFGPTLQITLDGGTDVVVEAPDENGVPRIRLLHGRMVVATVATAGAKLGVLFPHSEGVLEFTDADATTAIDCRGFVDLGEDPETEPGHGRYQIYAVSGRVNWTQGEGAPVIMTAGQTYAFFDRLAGIVEDAEEMPAWITSNASSAIDLRAAETIAATLTDDRPVELWFGELSEDRRVEIRSLAVRSLAHLGKFDEVIVALNDSDQRSSWDEFFDVLTAAVARSPEYAKMVRGSLEKRRGGEAPQLYRMLWGYSPDDLQQGEALALAEMLGHEALDFRVLAFLNLEKITGKTKMYGPSYTEARNRGPIRGWISEAETGAIKYAKPPETYPEMP
jgi:hypothetical protein